MASIDKLRQALSVPPTPLDLPASRRAAVAAIFTPQLDLLFMERAKVEGDPWSGHIAFPGGHEEDQDDSSLHTAMRETHEELGLDLSGAEVLGSLDEVTTVSGLPSSSYTTSSGNTSATSSAMSPYSSGPSRSL